MLQIKDLKIEYREHPLGMDEMHPRISWKLISEKENIKQTSYQIQVVRDQYVMWDTGVVNSDQSVCIVYEGEAFEKTTRYEIKVEITDNHGEKACVAGWFETGLLTSDNWKAEWITHGFEEDMEPCAVFVNSLPYEKK